MKKTSLHIIIVLCAFLLPACSSKQDASMISADPQSAQSVQETEALQAAPGTGAIFTDAELALVAQNDADKTPKFEQNIFFANAEATLTNIDAALDAEKSSPDNTVSLLAMRSLVYSQLGRNDEAFDDITTALRQKASPNLYAIRSIILWRSGKFRGAILDADYALKKQGNLPLANMAKGLGLLGNEQKDDSCDWLEEACDSGLCYGIEYAKKSGACQ